MSQIIQTISKHPVLGKDRAIRVKEITGINFDIHWARVTWEEVFLDAEGNPIMDETVSNRVIVSDIDNTNTVNENGIVIDSANFPKLENETDEEYQARLEDMKSKGFPEFDFYIGAILNTENIKQAIQVLDYLGRFNRK
jgi:hypothetical protein